MGLKNVYTLREAAEYLSISYRTGLKLAKNGALPFFRVGGQWRIKESDLDKYITETKRRPFLGEYLVYFRLQVLNRYRDNPMYDFEEKQFSGRFAMKEECYKTTRDTGYFWAKIKEIRFQKVPLLFGGSTNIAVCLDSEYYGRDVRAITYEYNHWHNYRIHSIIPNTLR